VGKAEEAEGIGGVKYEAGDKRRARTARIAARALLNGVPASKIDGIEVVYISIPAREPVQDHGSGGAEE
jgi:hypothetical protein